MAAAAAHPTYRPPLPGERFAYGGLSCVISAVVTNPVDLVKIRMQVYNELAAAAAAANGGCTATALRARPPGLTATLAAIVRDEGISGVMRGVTPSMLREATYRCVHCPYMHWLRGQRSLATASHASL
jgi:solute carrier family 25 protein 14/30